MLNFNVKIMNFQFLFLFFFCFNKIKFFFVKIFLSEIFFRDLFLFKKKLFLNLRLLLGGLFKEIGKYQKVENYKIMILSFSCVSFFLMKISNLLRFLELFENKVFFLSMSKFLKIPIFRDFRLFSKFFEIFYFFF